MYDSSLRRAAPVEEAEALWAYRHLALELAARDIKVRYKRSALGVAWSMLSPLLNMAVLTIAFAAVMRQQIANYPVFYLSGSILWAFFAQCTLHVGNLVIDANEMSRRMYLPRSVFVVSALLVALVNLLLTLVPFLAIVLATGARISLAWLALPLPIFLAALFTAGIALFIFTLATRFADVRETWVALLSIWFFATPVVFPRSVVPPNVALLVLLNPMTHFVEAFRSILYEGTLPSWRTLAAASVAASVSLAAGWLFYATRIEDYAARS